MSRSRWMATFVLVLPLTLNAAEPKAAEIADLIHRLGSERYADREAASRALEALGATALDALQRAALKGNDEEVRRRAGALLVRIGRRYPDKLHGTWKAVAAESEGMRMPADMMRGFALTFASERGTLSWPFLGATGTCRLDPAHDPKHFDVAVVHDGFTHVMMLRGIVKRDREDLVICFSFHPDIQERPTEFRTSAGSQTVLVTLRRE